MFDLLLILSRDFLSLSVHGRDISLIPLTQFVHSLDEVVSLLGQLSKLVVHQNFLLAGPHLLISE